MIRIYSLIAVLVLAIAAQGQTLNVVVGNVTYQFPAAQVGDMNYTDGTTLTIMNKVFTLGDISKIFADETKVAGNQVTVAYDALTRSYLISVNN